MTPTTTTDRHSKHIVTEAEDRGYSARIIPVGHQGNQDFWSCGYIVLYWVISSARAAGPNTRWQTRVITPNPPKGWCQLIHHLANLNTMEEDNGSDIGGRAWAPSIWRTHPLARHGKTETMNITNMTTRVHQITRQANTMWANRRTANHRLPTPNDEHRLEDSDDPEVEERGRDWAETPGPTYPVGPAHTYATGQAPLLTKAASLLPLMNDIEQAETSSSSSSMATLAPRHGHPQVNTSAQRLPGKWTPTHGRTAGLRAHRPHTHQTLTHCHMQKMRQPRPYTLDTPYGHG
jgi:hypothetical protein